MADCVFCGAEVKKSVRTKEHILPMWLLEATGDPNREIRLWDDPITGRPSFRPASTFHFPACHDCNQRYGRTLEAQSKKIISAISEGRSITVGNAYRLLDWLDKVRIGLWLGYQMLHGEGDFNPKFQIDTRLGRKDRLAIVAVDAKETRKRLTFGATDNNLFRMSQCGVFLHINNVKILSFSADYLLAAETGLPSTDEAVLVSGKPGFNRTLLKPGNYTLAQDWSALDIKGATLLAQPIIDTRFGDVARSLNLYGDSRILRHAKDALHINGLEHFRRILPLQLISNIGGTFRYHGNKRKRLQLNRADPISEQTFLITLYRLMLQRALRQFPTRILLPSGEVTNWYPGLLNYLVCTWQILSRLGDVGLQSPDSDEIIRDIQLLDRALEENYAHADGSLVKSEPLIDGRRRGPS